MEKLQFRLTYSKQFAAITSRKLWNQLIEEPSWRVPGEYWHRVMRPHHFTPAAMQRYNYAKRSGQSTPRGTKKFWSSYLGRKLREKKHARPLEYSGQTKRESQTAEIRTTSKSVRVIMRLAKANFRHPRSSVDIRREVTLVRPDEGEKLTRLKERAMVRLLGTVTAEHKKTIGG